MINIIGALATMLAVFGGGLAVSGHVIAGSILAGIGATTLGTMFAMLRTNNEVSGAVGDGVEAVGGGLTVGLLKTFLSTHAVADDTLVYVGDSGLNPAAGVFRCRLDGINALVVERMHEDESPQRIIHPFEEVR